MSLARDSSDWERLDPDKPEPIVEQKAIRRATRRIGHGAFACPGCELPLLPPGPVSISAAIECPFCGEAAPASSFLRLHAFDTPRNHVSVQARLPS